MVFTAKLKEGGIAPLQMGEAGPQQLFGTTVILGGCLPNTRK
jgi:hypothetical protein